MHKKWLELQEITVKKILNLTPRSKKPFMKEFLQFAKMVVSSNEARRSLVTRTFKITCSALKDLNLDPKTTTLNQLLETLQKKQRGISKTPLVF